MLKPDDCALLQPEINSMYHTKIVPIPKEISHTLNHSLNRMSCMDHFLVSASQCG